MQPLSDAVALTRALLTVAERRGCHRVHVTSAGRRATLWVRDGWLHRVTGVDAELLGDTLLRHGVLDLARYAAALERWDPRERVGDWLVRVGAADAAAVTDALELQAMARVAALLRWPTPSYQRHAWRFEASESEPRVSLVVAGWLSLRALLHEPRAAPFAPCASRTSLSPFGVRLQHQLARHGLGASWDAALAGETSAMDTRIALDLLGATRSPRAPHGDAHGLLLRKHRELCRRVAAHVLLEIPASAGSVEAKRAYRRLVRKLHPDRFGLDNPLITRRATEVVRGLSDAVRGFTTVATQHGCAVP